MTHALVTPPATEPLSLAEVKAHLRVDHDREDQLIAQTLKAATQYVEFACDQKMLTQVWRQYVDCFPVTRELALTVKPVQSVAAITAFGRDGTPNALSLDDVEMVRGLLPPVLRFSAAVDPGLAVNGLEIDLVVGLGDLGVDIPDTLKRAILMLVAHWYEFRGAIPPHDQPVSLPSGFDALMRPFRGARL